MTSLLPSSSAARFGMGLFIACFVLIALWSRLNEDGPIPVSESSSRTGSLMKDVPSANETFSLEAVSQEDLNRMQVQANDAVVAETAFTPLHSPLKDRPDYVSSLEWSVLRQLASSREHPEQALVNLVLALRFNKQVDWWQQHHSVAPSATSEHVAQFILDSIPERVENQDLDVAQAQQLQIEIIDATVADAGRRQQLRQREAQRIGVVFDIQQGK